MEIRAVDSLVANLRSRVNGHRCARLPTLLVRRLACSAMASVLISAGGCGSNNGALIDSLRRNVLTLENNVRDLEMANAELRAEIARLSRTDDPSIAELREFIPRVVAISIDRLSHAVDTTSDGRADRLVVYLTPVDGRSRFVPMVGEITVSVLDVSTDGQPRTLGRTDLGPGDIRDAYRSGITGTYYRFDVPIETPLDDAAPLSVIIRAEFNDGITGLTHIADRTVDLAHVRRRPAADRIRAGQTVD